MDLSAGPNRFCVGVENKPEYAGEDWMRIAELQARNKAYLPHLKSSYPLESRVRRGYSLSHLAYTFSLSK